MNICVVVMSEDERFPEIYFVDVTKMPDGSPFKQAVLHDVVWERMRDTWDEEWRKKREEGTLKPEDDYPFLCVAEERFGLSKDGNLIDELPDEDWFDEAQLTFPCQVDAIAHIFY